ncbi:MAG: hypothetical protein CMF59_01110 [Leptospiraceae bacterium]|nr:hypothetical protein [Leptospiraceae bacterium]
MKKLLVIASLLALSTSCSLLGLEEEDDNSQLQALALWALLQPSTSCTNDSGMVVCIPPGFVTD